MEKKVSQDNVVSGDKYDGVGGQISTKKKF